MKKDYVCLEDVLKAINSMDVDLDDLDDMIRYMPCIIVDGAEKLDGKEGIYKDVVVSIKD